MTEPFIGEIRTIPFNFAPLGWALCNGQIMSIQQNTALFSLLGTYYGGDGRTTFGLPNLQARVPVHAGQGPGLSSIQLGQTGGAATVTLQPSQIPAHTHSTSAVATTNRPGPGNMPADGGVYTSLPTGAAQPHSNLPPYLVVHFIIALQGIYPSRP